MFEFFLSFCSFFLLVAFEKVYPLFSLAILEISSATELLILDVVLPGPRVQIVFQLTRLCILSPNGKALVLASQHVHRLRCITYR